MTSRVAVDRSLGGKPRRVSRERGRHKRPGGDAAGPELVGYIQAKAGDTDGHSEQRQALQDAGCHHVVEDVVSAGRWDQPELRRLPGRLKPGDVVVVARLLAFGASLRDVVRRVHEFEAAGVGVRSLGDAFDTTTPAGRTVAQAVASLAALDRDLARGRIGVGLAAARTEGRARGRPSKLTARQKLTVAHEVLSGRHTAAFMAQHHKVSEATVSRLVSAHRAGAAASEAGRPEGGGARHGDKIVGVLPFAALDGRVAIVGTSGSGKPTPPKAWSSG